MGHQHRRSKPVSASQLKPKSGAPRRSRHNGVTSRMGWQAQLMRGATPGSLLGLQRTVGNQATVQQVARVTGPGRGTSGGEPQVQRASCQEELGPPGTPSNQADNYVEAAQTRLYANLQSWEPYLISEVGGIAQGLFRTEQEVAWWGKWALDLVLDVIPAGKIAGPVVAAVKGAAAAGEHIAQMEIADARDRLGDAARDAVVRLRTDKETEGEAYIEDYWRRLRLRTEGECAGYQQLLFDSVDKFWPRLRTNKLGEARRLARKVMEHVRQQQRLEELRREYERCVRYALELPGGVLPEDEQRQAREDCRRQTGYYPIGAC